MPMERRQIYVNGLSSPRLQREDPTQQSTPAPTDTPADMPKRKQYNHQRSVNIMQEWLHRDFDNLDNIFNSIPEDDMNRINAAADGIPSPTPVDNPTKSQPLPKNIYQQQKTHQEEENQTCYKGHSYHGLLFMHTNGYE